MTRLSTFYWTDDGVYLIYLIMAFIAGYKYSKGKEFAISITKLHNDMLPNDIRQQTLDSSKLCLPEVCHFSFQPSPHVHVIFKLDRFWLTQVSHSYNSLR